MDIVYVKWLLWVVIILGIIFTPYYLHVRGFFKPVFAGVVTFILRGKPFQHSRQYSDNAYTVWYVKGKLVLYSSYIFCDSFLDEYGCPITVGMLTKAMRDKELGLLLEDMTLCTPVESLGTPRNAVTLQKLKRQGLKEIPFPGIPPTEDHLNYVCWVFGGR